jgi:mannose-6-phosphate isomerase
MPTSAFPPLAFSPIPVARPWGGRSAHELLGLSLHVDAAGADPIGEWWLLAARPGRASRVSGGPLDGASLADLLAHDADRLVGRRHAREWQRRFPLLLKILETASPLSIQVHPSDAEVPGEGKTETWYLLSAADGASFWLGLEPGHRPDEVIERARRGQSPDALLARHPARRGTIAHVPAGVIHALGAGIVAIEFQTSADTTFRIWDWGRTPARPLHLDDAQRVARRKQDAELPAPRACGQGSPPCDQLISCSAYHVDRLLLSGPSHLATDGERFEVLLPIGASVRVAGQHGAADVPRGHAVLVPAETADYVVTPESRAAAGAAVELLRFVPAAPQGSATGDGR